MRTQSPTNKHTNSNGQRTAAALRVIPLKEITPSPNNTRQHSDAASLKSLTESIRRQGVLQPILVRESAAANGSAKYQIIAGERRFRAAQAAGLKEIPAQVRKLDDADALSAQIVENLQRAEIHPLDEAAGFLRLKEEMKLSLREIAARVAKDTRYIARRLALPNLIEEARVDFRKERITLAHALEICRLAPEIQTEALAACYEVNSVFNQKANSYEYQPDKTRPARHVSRLREWIAQNIQLDLKRAPFSLDDARLREDGLTCLACPQRSGHDRALFADIQKRDVCLNPRCFQAKLQTFVQITRTELEAKSGKPAVFISTHYGARTESDDAIGRDQYQIIERKADRCACAEAAVYADGDAIGQVKWICREQTCKDHLGRVPEYRQHAATNGARSASSAEHNQRRQELFDVKTAEAVRKQVMREAVKTFAWPLDRQHLNEAVKEFFHRIPVEHQRVICEVYGWPEDEAAKLRYDEAATLAKLAALSDDGLAQFLMLCSFAHYGANREGRSWVDQSAVVRLSEERSVNYTLIDATVRAELCPKKYKAAHQAYLAAVKKGEAAGKPVVYERAQQEREQTQTVEAKRRGGGKAA